MVLIQSDTRAYLIPRDFIYSDLFLALVIITDCMFLRDCGNRLAVILNGKEAIADAMMRHGEAFADKPGLWTEATCLNKGLRGRSWSTSHY